MESTVNMWSVLPDDFAWHQQLSLVQPFFARQPWSCWHLHCIHQTGKLLGFFFHAGRLSDLTCKVLQRCSSMFLTAVSKRCSINCVPAAWQDYTRWITSSRTLQCAVARFLKRPAKGPFCWLLMVGWFGSGFESIWGSAVVGLRRIMQGIWKMGGWTNGNGTPFSCRQMSQWPTMQ